MNERIKELAEQCWRNDYGYFDKEKFAELIVKECIDICKDVNRNPYLEDEYQARQIIKNIEKHFGVE